MGKWSEFKSYVLSPPPHILARIEYRGHFLNILGVLAVSLVLMFKGYWYAIFAFIFSTLVSYSQGMSALQRYRVFVSMLPEETYEYILSDKSFTRKRQRLVNKRYVFYIRWLVLFSCFIIIIKLFGLQSLTYSNLNSYLKVIIYVIKIGLSTLVFYFIYLYLLIAYFIEKNERTKLKDGILEKNTDA